MARMPLAQVEGRPESFLGKSHPFPTMDLGGCNSDSFVIG